MRNRLCHLLISVDNESMALEEFIIDLCEESVNGALLVGAVSPTVAHCAYASYRHFGSSKPTSTTSPQIQIRTRSKHAGGYTTRSSALSSVPPSRSDERRSRRISFPSPCCQAWSLLALQHLSFPDMLVHWRSRKPANHDRLTT